jgi:hypothetical protein
MKPRRKQTPLATRIFAVLALLVILSMILSLFLPVTLDAR